MYFLFIFFFSVRSNFISLMNTKTCIFTHSYCHSRNNCFWCSFSEVKFHLTLIKSNILNLLHRKNTKTSIFTRGFFFQCKIEFYFTEWTPKAVFSRVAVATSGNASFVFIGETKSTYILIKINFSVSFMVIFTIIKLLHILWLSRQTTFFLAISWLFGLVQRV